MKIALDSNDAWEMQEQYKGQPHGWIQWKGTDVCMDVHCKCGELFHIDDSFTYTVKCLACETVYYCNGHIELIEIVNVSEDERSPSTDSMQAVRVQIDNL